MVAHELSIEAGSGHLSGILTSDMLLSLSAFLVTNLWLDATWKAAQADQQPEPSTSARLHQDIVT